MINSCGGVQERSKGPIFPFHVVGIGDRFQLWHPSGWRSPLFDNWEDAESCAYCPKFAVAVEIAKQDRQARIARQIADLRACSHGGFAVDQSAEYDGRWNWWGAAE